MRVARVKLLFILFLFIFSFHFFFDETTDQFSPNVLSRFHYSTDRIWISQIDFWSMSLKLHDIVWKCQVFHWLKYAIIALDFFGCIYVRHGKILQPIQILLKINSYFKWYMLYTVLLKIQTRWHFIPIIWFYCIQKKTRFISLKYGRVQTKYISNYYSNDWLKYIIIY